MSEDLDSKISFDLECAAAELARSSSLYARELIKNSDSLKVQKLEGENVARISGLQEL